MKVLRCFLNLKFQMTLYFMSAHCISNGKSWHLFPRVRFRFGQYPGADTKLSSPGLPGLIADSAKRFEQKTLHWRLTKTKPINQKSLHSQSYKQKQILTIEGKIHKVQTKTNPHKERKNPQSKSAENNAQFSKKQKHKPATGHRHR